MVMGSNPFWYHSLEMKSSHIYYYIPELVAQFKMQK